MFSVTSLPSFFIAAALTSASALDGEPSTLQSVASKASLESPWGVDAHPHRHYQFDNLDQMVQHSNKAGIEWMRIGFGFSTVCKNPNKMDFDRFDQVVNKLEGGNINLMAMLQGFDSEVTRTRPELVPLYNHPEEWRKYVRATVEHYHDRIKHWVIWNEQDGGFWKPRPNAEQYVLLLKIAYEEIKAIDPTCKVVVGGLTDFNADYLKEMYAAGAKGNFDIMACHRYGWGVDGNPQVRRVMQEFRRVLADNQQKEMPIWILESGNATHTAALMRQQPNFMMETIRYSLQKIGRPLSGLPTVGIAVSPRSRVNEVATTRRWLPGVKIRPIALEELKDLDPAECPVLIGAESKNIEEPLMEPLRKYVEHGGLLLAFGRLPFYTMLWQTPEGVWKSADKPGETNPFFRIGFDAFWTKKGLPEWTNSVKTSPEALAAGLPAVSNIYIDRFFNARNLKPNDNYFPIIQAMHNGKSIGEGMALYTYNDWKGGILLSNAAINAGFTEEEQANLVPRMYLTYLSEGIGKIFWYDFQDDGQQAGEPEHNFGMLRWNWAPKPAYYAYKEMTEALGKNPTFVKRLPCEGDDTIWALVFRRAEDNREILATWSSDESKSYSIFRDGAEASIGGFKGTEVHYIPIESASTDYRVEMTKTQ